MSYIFMGVGSSFSSSSSYRETLGAWAIGRREEVEEIGNRQIGGYDTYVEKSNL